MQSSNSLSRRSSMATAASPPAQVVANAFVHQYYHILHSSPEFVFRFYHEDSKFGRPDATGEMTSISGLEAINENIVSMEYSETKAEIKTVDAQESLAGGLTVLVTGCLTGKDEVRRSFTQSFFLAPQDKGYYVLNDIFRYVDDAEAAVPVAAAAELGKLPHKLPGIRTKVASMEVTNTPKEDNKLAHDKPASAKQFFNCDICKVRCDRQSTLNSHINGKKHRAHLEKLLKQDEKLISLEEANKLANEKPATAEQLFKCDICKVKYYRQSMLSSHLNGKKHKAHLEELNKVQDNELIKPKEDNKIAIDKPDVAKQSFNCDICKAKCYDQSTLNSHINGKKHRAHLEKLLKRYEKLISLEEANKLANEKPATAEQLFKCDISFQNMKTGNREENSLEVECDDDEDCCEIDPIILTSKLTFDDMDDVALVAEKGPVALRDFPHPRHLCGCFPLGTTSHESFCTKCFCCVCEVVAPCSQWRGINGHCHLSGKIHSKAGV